VQMPGPVAAGTGPSAKFPKTMESDSDEELDSEDLDESDGEVLLSYIVMGRIEALKIETVTTPLIIN